VHYSRVQSPRFSGARRSLSQSQILSVRFWEDSAMTPGSPVLTSRHPASNKGSPLFVEPKLRADSEFRVSHLPRLTALAFPAPGSLTARERFSEFPSSPRRSPADAGALLPSQRNRRRAVCAVLAVQAARRIRVSGRGSWAQVPALAVGRSLQPPRAISFFPLLPPSSPAARLLLRGEPSSTRMPW
jgi:hypothetical protein